MQRATKAELQMLRELVWLLVSTIPGDGDVNVFNPYQFCCFCHGPLLSRPKGMTFGHRRHPSIESKITVHHDNRNREDSTPANLKLSHRRCHQQYHANLRRTSDPPDAPDS